MQYSNWKTGKGFCIPLLISGFLLSFIVILLSGCSADGLRLLSQLEARDLKDDAIAKRQMCFDEFIEEVKFNECYINEVYSLIADECVNIRITEPVTQKECEDFLYRVVMKPDTFFPEYSTVGEGFPAAYRGHNLHPVLRRGGCIDSDACRENCRTIFTEQDTRTACYEYSTVAIGKIKNVFNVLKEPSLPSLRNLETEEHLRSLRLLFGIGLTDVITRFSSVLPADPPADGDLSWDNNERKIILSWLAESSDVAEIMNRFDTTFSLLENIMGDAANSGTVANLNKGLGANDSGDNFIDKLLDEENESGLLWLHSYIASEQNCNSVERCMFKDFYCAFEFHNSSELDLFEYKFFTELLDYILKTHKGSNAPSWWDVNTTSVDLEPDQWKNGVCNNVAN